LTHSQQQLTIATLSGEKTMDTNGADWWQIQQLLEEMQEEYFRELCNMLVNELLQEGENV
jgi:hypothetical protein